MINRAITFLLTPLLALLLINFIGLNESCADQITLHPAAGGSVNTFTTIFDCWDCVNDQTGNAHTGAAEPSDGATSYIEDNKNVTNREMYDLDDDGLVTPNSTITDIRIYASMARGSAPKATGAQLCYRRVGIDGGYVCDSSHSVIAGYNLYDSGTTWSGLSWTNADLDALEIGVYHVSGDKIRVSQIYVTVTYIPGPTEQPVGGWTADNVIPAAQISQATDGSGIITINWKGRDPQSDNVTLKSFEYSVDGGSFWNAPTNGDLSASLSANWDDNGGGGWSTATDFASAVAHSFTFNAKHTDLSGLNGVDQSDVRIRFRLNDGSDDSINPATSENFQVDNENPTTTYASAEYQALTNTMVITGANFTTMASAATDIKTYVEWSKFIWDINGDNATTADITFAIGDISSLTVTDDTTLTLILAGAKASEIEGNPDYGVVNGADTLDITAGFSKDGSGNAATTDNTGDAPILIAPPTLFISLHPAANGTANTFTNGIQGTCTDNFDCTNDQAGNAHTGAAVAADNNTSYIENAKNNYNKREMFDLNDDGLISSGMTVSEITVYATILKVSSPTPQFQLSYQRVGTDASYINGTQQSAGNSWTQFSQTWTGLSWTNEDIDALEIGIFLISGGITRISQIYVMITCASTASGPDSFTISHGGVASACGSTPVTITAKQGETTFTDYTGAITITTSTNNGDWSKNTALGALNPDPDSDDNGAVLYTFVAGDAGVAVLDLYNSHAETLTIDVDDGSATGSSTPLVYLAAGLQVDADGSDPDVDNVETQIVGRSHYFAGAATSVTIRATAGGCGVMTDYTGLKTLKWWVARDGSDPGGAALKVNNTTIGGNEAGAVAIPINFTNGAASVNVDFPDAGLWALHVRDEDGDGDSDVNGVSDNLDGNTNTFLVRPFALRIDPGSIQSGAISNPQAADHTGNDFIAAGAVFQADITAVAWESADDDNGAEADDGIPDSDADITDNSVVANFAWNTAVTHTLVEPSGGANGILSDGGALQTDYSGGTATDNNLKWNEVGIITLTAQATGYLGTAEDIPGTASVNIGRFIPYYFSTSIIQSGLLAAGCSTGTSFTYTGHQRSYTINPAISITAFGADNNLPANYKDNFQYLNPGGTVSLTYPTKDSTQPGAEGPLVDINATQDGSPTWNTTGNPVIYTLGNDTFTYTRNSNAMVGPFTPGIDIKLTAVNDGDGVAANDLGTAKDISPAGSEIRYGRAAADNTYGPVDNLRPLEIPVYVEYYDGLDWGVNTDDGCTSYTYSSSTDAVDGVTTTDSPVSPVTLNSGYGNISVTPTGDQGEPGGEVNFTFTFPAYLLPDPSAEAGFGIYRGNDRIINWQEIVR